MLSGLGKGASEPVPSLQARASLRRHAMAAAACFAAQAQVDIEDKALALIAEFMIAVTLTDVHRKTSFHRIPHGVMAAARLLFSLDELEIAREEVLADMKIRVGIEEERDASEAAEKTVAHFFDTVETEETEKGDPIRKLLKDRRVVRGKTDCATVMALMIDTWRKRRRRERQVARELRALSPPGWTKPKP